MLFIKRFYLLFYNRLPGLLLNIVLIVFVAFGIRVITPAKPVNSLLWQSKQALGGFVVNNNLTSTSMFMGQNLPLFFISVHAAVIPGNLQQAVAENHIIPLKKLLLKYGNSKYLWQYYFGCISLAKQQMTSNPIYINQLYAGFANSDLKTQENTLRKMLSHASTATIKAKSNELLFLCTQIQKKSTSLIDLLPVVTWHSQNQFKEWMLGNGKTTGLSTGNFGVSFNTHQSVNTILKQRLAWSVGLATLAFLISLSIALPLGIIAGFQPSSVFAKALQIYQVCAITVPLFVIAMLLLLIFANTDFLSIFPASIHSVANFGITSFLVLPLFCYCYDGIAFQSQIIATQIQHTLKQLHVLMAKSLGFGRRYIIIKHVMPAVSITLLSVFVQWIPAAMAGSLIIENIFSIPGIGYEMVQAVYSQNYPILSAIVLISGVATVIADTIVGTLQKMINPNTPV